MMNDKKKEARPFILGLDLGTASVGWAMVAVDEDRKPTKLIRCGSRVFPEGVARPKGNTEVSRNLERRLARGARRLRERRRRRMTKLRNELARQGLLPATPAGFKVCMAEEPYRLRALGLDSELESYQFGRAIYHLAQRRGFKSNRKDQSKEKEDGKVKEGIAKLRDAMQRGGSRTIGEYLARLNPIQQRRRGRYLGRNQVLDEFQMLWAVQEQFDPSLAEEGGRQRVEEIIFFQRPLKPQAHLLGRCSLEPGRHRAPKAHLVAQDFRVWQTVVHTRMQEPDGKVRPLTEAEHEKLLAAFHSKMDVAVKALAQKLLKLPEGFELKLPVSGSTKLPACRTRKRMEKAFGGQKDLWFDMVEATRRKLVGRVIDAEDSDEFEGELKREWGFGSDLAERVSAVRLEPGYMNLSLCAMEKLLPFLRDRQDLTTARVNAGYQLVDGSQGLSYLPPIPNLRNPMVMRTLAELRRVVNAIIREHGKPLRIKLELARDLKLSSSQRERALKTQRENTREREKAAAALVEAGFGAPGRTDILKYILWQECGHVCPYTGQAIGFSDLFGPNPRFDIEHIHPFSRTLDNSFMNKTLCELRENREIKGNKTPYEAYGHDEPRWEAIVARARRLPGPKARRFLDHEIREDFAARQLSDTRYISREARAYLQKLGIGVDVVTGQVTAYMRNVYQLNGLLTGGGIKTREDHRHHTVDALAVTLTTQGTVQRLAKASARLGEGARLRWEHWEEPWPHFHSEVATAVNNVIVSHRLDKKISGSMHRDTFYGETGRTNEKGKPIYKVRKAIADLKEKDLIRIIDGEIAELARKHLEKSKNWKDAFANEEKPFGFKAASGEFIPIRKVRIEVVTKIDRVGSGDRVRLLELRENHHLEVFEITNIKGRTRRDGIMVSRFEAYRRRRFGLHIYRSELPEGVRRLYTLSIGDYILKEEKEGSRRVYCVQKMSESSRGALRLGLRLHSDARPATEIQDAGELWQPSVNTLGGEKASCDVLGRLRRASD